MSQAEKDNFFAHLESLNSETDDDEDAKSPPHKRSRIDNEASSNIFNRHSVARKPPALAKPEPLEVNPAVPQATLELQGPSTETIPKRGPRGTTTKTSKKPEDDDAEALDIAKSGIFIGLIFCEYSSGLQALFY